MSDAHAPRSAGPSEPQGTPSVPRYPGASPVPDELTVVRARNERLAEALGKARETIADLREQIDSLAKPPGTYALFSADHGDGTVDVIAAGRKMHVGVGPGVEPATLRPGQEVKLNESMTVVDVGDYDVVGEIVTVKELLGDERALVVGRSDDERVVRLAGPLLAARPRVGDALTADTRAGFAFERVLKSEVQDLVLEEVPDITYDDIGGLGPQIEIIRDAVELPFTHPELYREHGLRPPKGILLYGPPGCGKTLIAKAVARSLATARRRADAAATGGPVAASVPEADASGRSYFLNIKGPELLNKYVGETERHIRLIFSRAREKASDGTPVVVFFDEMESLFRTRGTGLSSDVETTIVPQLLSEIDGVESLDNVIVIGASNREDMIDPAILRPGRLDVKIKIERPDAEAARDIFSKYLVPSTPLHPDDLAEHGGDVDLTLEAMIQAVVEKIYAVGPENEFLEVTYASGDKEVLYFKDFSSGAMIQNVVDRAKKYAIKDYLASGQRGLRVDHLLRAADDELHENEDLPNTTNPDDWARVSGKKGERIVFIRTIVQRSKGTEPVSARTVEDVTTTGQYL